MKNNFSIIKITFIFFFLISLPSISKGASVTFLKIPVGARPAALGGAFSAFKGSPDSIYYNPGSLAFIDNMAVSFMRANYIGDFKHDWLSLAKPHRNGAVSAIAINSLSIDSIDGYDDIGHPIDSVSSVDLAVSLAHSKKINLKGSRFFKEIGLGLNLKYITERLDTERANAFAIDLGILAETSIENFNFSFVAENMGTKMKFIEDSFYLPFRMKAGLLFGKDIFNLKCLYSAEIIIPADGKKSFRAGIETILNEQFFFRLGWQNSRDLVSHLTYGLGYVFNLSKKMDMNIDYAFADYGEFGNVHRFGLTLKFAQNKVALQRAEIREQKSDKVDNAVREITSSTTEEIIEDVKEVSSVVKTIAEPVIEKPVEVIISTPEAVLPTPEVIISAPEAVSPTPEVIISAPEVQISTQATEIIAKPQIPISPITISSQTIESLPASPLKSVGIKIGESILDLEPQNVSNAFNLKVKRVYCWTKIISTKFPTKIKHIWYVDGKKVVEINLPVKAGSWRTWSTTRVFWGRWKVEVVDENGVLLDSIKFTVGDQYYSGSLSITESVLKSVGIKIGESIFDREPQNVSKTFNLKVKRVYCWTKIISTKFPIKIKHIWYVDGKKVVGINLPVKAGSWRTWSTTGVFWGRWKVEVVDENGVLLDSIKFTVGDQHYRESLPIKEPIDEVQDTKTEVEKTDEENK